MMSNRLWQPTLVVLAASAVFFLNLGGTRLWDDDEPKNAACGREMLERGDWVVPMFNAQLRDHKPVMLYWAMMASYTLVGDTDVGARLPSAIASVLTVLMCFHLGRLLLGRAEGLAAGLLLSSGLMFSVLARAATPDGVLICCSTAALLAFVAGVAKLRGGTFSGNGRPLTELRLPTFAWVASYGAMGLAVLTKGPIGVLLPFGVIAVYAVLMDAVPQNENTKPATRRAAVWGYFKTRFAFARLWKLGLALRVWQGLALTLAVALPWYVAVSIATNGAWLQGFLGTHNVGRFMNPMENHSGPIYYYLVTLLLGFFPASCFLPIGVAGSVIEGRNGEPRAASHRFMLAWIATYLVFFSLAATKLPNYVAPCYPALALVTGAWLVRAGRSIALSRETVLGGDAPSARKRHPAWDLMWLRIGLGSMAVVGLGLAIGLVVASAIGMQRDLLLASAGLVGMIGAVVALVMLERSTPKRAVGAFVAACLVFTITAHAVVAPRITPYQASHNIAEKVAAIDAAEGPEALPVATYRFTKPNVVWYLHHPVEALQDERCAIDFLRENSGAVLILPRDVYEELRNDLPTDTSVLASQGRFFKPDEEVLAVGRSALVARLPQQVR